MHCGIYTVHAVQLQCIRGTEEVGKENPPSVVSVGSR